jgi:hypothetical protein
MRNEIDKILSFEHFHQNELERSKLKCDYYLAYIIILRCQAAITRTKLRKVRQFSSQHKRKSPLRQWLKK